MLLSLILVAGLTSGLQAPTDEKAVITLRRVRGVDASIRATIDEGCHRSPTFAALMDYLERSSFVVYVEQVPTLRDGMRGALLHGGTGPLYLRILLKRGMSLDQRVVVLAHELQHAREVAEANIAADAREMEALFRRIGDERSPARNTAQYETAAALLVTSTVAAELRERRGDAVGVGHCRGDR